MDGYYDPYPLLVLSRPLTLVGQPGSGVSQVGHALTAMTGLPLNDVDRLVESMAGRSLTRMRFEDGAEAIRELEAVVLRRALDRRPNGVIVARSESLVDERLRAQALDASCVVALMRPPEVLLRRIQSRRDDAREVLALPEFERILAAHEPGMRSAHVLFDGGDRHASRLADELEESLDRIVGIESRRAPHPPH